MTISCNNSDSDPTPTRLEKASITVYEFPSGTLPKNEPYRTVVNSTETLNQIESLFTKADSAAKIDPSGWEASVEISLQFDDKHRVIRSNYLLWSDNGKGDWRVDDPKALRALIEEIANNTGLEDGASP